MITLSDIDSMFPETHDGSLFSDVWKEVYGRRPRDIWFDNVEEFNREYNILRQQQEDLNSSKTVMEAKNLEKFKTTIEGIRAKYYTKKAALEHLLNKEDLLADYEFYGDEIVESFFDLPYGSFEEFMKEN